MAYLLDIIQPDTGVFTSQGIIHAFAFDSLLAGQIFTNETAKQEQLKKLIAMEKGKLLTSLPIHGQAIFNSDDAHITIMGQQSKARQLTFGFNPNATISCQKHNLVWRNNQLTSTFSFRIAEEATTLTLSFSSQLLFAQYAYNLAPAILLARQAGIDAATIKKALEQEFTLPASRASIFTGKNQSLIIDSSYNASGMLDMLQTLIGLQPKQGRKLALLGDMRELGESTQALHEALAKLLLKSDIDRVFLVGQSMRQFVLPILEKSTIPVQHFTDAVMAGKSIAKELRKHDLILVKGSQNTIFLEDAVVELLANPADRDKVCRQESAWQKRKQK
jgi:UDP-N-acetylmuramoyl-tripeptide--D-alanyl-D-alanine ligase